MVVNGKSEPGWYDTLLLRLGGRIHGRSEHLGIKLERRSVRSCQASTADKNRKTTDSLGALLLSEELLLLLDNLGLVLQAQRQR